MSIRIFLALLVLLAGGCKVQWTRPPQGLFIFQTDPMNVGALADDLARSLGSHVEKFPTYKTPEQYIRKIHATDYDLVVVPVPDNQCEPNQSAEERYRKGKFRLDLVYHVPPEKEPAIKDAVRTMFAQRHIKLSQFEECPSP